MAQYTSIRCETNRCGFWTAQRICLAARMSRLRCSAYRKTNSRSFSERTRTMLSQVFSLLQLLDFGSSDLNPFCRVVHHQCHRWTARLHAVSQRIFSATIIPGLHEIFAEVEDDSSGLGESPQNQHFDHKRNIYDAVMETNGSCGF